MRWWLLPFLAYMSLAFYQHFPQATQPGLSDRPNLAYVFDYPFNVLRIPGGEPWCPASSPNLHVSPCKPAAQCSPWYASMIHESPLWCVAQDGSFGACCPDVYMSTTSVARFPEFSKLVAMPREITPAEMSTITTFAKKLVEDIASFETKAWGAMLSHWENSAGFSYSANTRAALLGQQEGWKALQAVEASRKLAALLKLEPAQAGFALQNIDVKSTSLKGICRAHPVCDESYPYRTYDGSCNNLKYPNWGRSNSPLERILPPQYLDGIWGPREWPGIPPVDSVSSIVQDADLPDTQLTSSVMHWGQLIAHDLTHVPTFRTLNNTAIQCCTFDGKYLVPEQTHPLCFAIDVSRDHEFYGQFGVSCQHFVRSVIAPRDDCKLGYAEQLNQNTAYLDGSAIYGSTDDVVASLRQFSEGKLRVTVLGDYHLLPTDLSRKDCIVDHHGADCFVAGDVRVNQYTGLTVMHTIWVRMHNRIAHELSKVNPTWDDEKLFQETRKILVAVMQHITYNEYLPAILGPKLMEDYGLLPLTTGFTHTYNPAVKAQITNEFATGAFRFGHSLVRNSNDLWLDDTYANYGGELHLKDWYNNPKVLLNAPIFDAMIRHFIIGTIQNFDENIASSIHHYLFKPPFQSWGLDLISANLWRARDHGIPGYNFYLEACGHKRAANFEDLQTIMRPSVIEKIKYLYKSVDDIDIYIGILGEWPVKGGILGPVASCIIADQFTRLKDGDRFFYENGMQPHSFTPGQLESIRTMSLARVFCDTADSIEWITPKTFWTPSERNPWLSCHGKDIPRLDLNLWKS